jgi:hypothetical protein
MFVPSSKGWIQKYFDMIEKGEVDLPVLENHEVDTDHFIHATLGKTGIIYGYPNELLFAANLDLSKWTNDEKLKVLLFESHLFVYKATMQEEVFDQEDFIAALVHFYGHHQASAMTKLFGIFIKENPMEKLEGALIKRTNIKTSYKGSKLWMNYLNNFFIYIDVILFKDFLAYRKSSTLVNYDELAMNALTAITLAAHSDGKIEQAEQSMFDVFLASANLSSLQNGIATSRYKEGSSFEDFTDKARDNYLFKRFLLDLSAFVIYSNHAAEEREKEYLKVFCDEMHFTEDEYNTALLLTEQFVLNNHEQIAFLQDGSNLEKMYGNVSKRWVLILGRNRDRLAKEFQQSKELVALIKKSRSKELSKEEKEVVRTQFMDIVKTVPSLAIFLLPGGAILLPIVLKVIPNLIPSAFRDNEVVKDETAPAEPAN